MGESMTDAWTVRGEKHEYAATGADPLTCSLCGRSAGFVMHRRTSKETTR